MTDKITCKICGGETHSIQRHLKETHDEWGDLAKYREEFPDAPILSEMAIEKLKTMRREAKPEPLAPTTDDDADHTKEPMNVMFDLGAAKAAMSSKGSPIPVTVLKKGVVKDYVDMIPEIESAYVFNIELLKNVMLGMELNKPIYIWGHAGTGKTTLHEQVSARTNRPFLRVQHTINTEESHIVGQYLLKDGATIFEYGPLAVAMKYGLTYCADEYDFSMPSVLSVYQPVLEGKPLVIKEAPAHLRVVRPHKNFRFVATGNTNGIGDETGLYQGTNIQNAANYERFAIVEEVQYMDEKNERNIIVNQVGISKAHASELVKFAKEIRKAYSAGKIGMTISPRALINAGLLGMLRMDYRKGLALAFMNRLSRTDKVVADQFAQRIFGGS